MLSELFELKNKFQLFLVWLGKLNWIFIKGLLAVHFSAKKVLTIHTFKRVNEMKFRFSKNWMFMECYLSCSNSKTNSSYSSYSNTDVLNQGHLITDGRKSSKVTGPSVGLNLEIGQNFRAKVWKKFFQMDDFIDRRCYRSHFLHQIVVTW